MRLPALWLMIRPARQALSTSALSIAAFAIITLMVMHTAVIARLFWTAPEGSGANRVLAGALLVVLLVPLVTLGGAAARLSARRRDERLATLRLLGAPARWVRRSAVGESAALAAIGALAGTVLHLASAPLLTFLPVQGRTHSVPEIWLPAWSVLAILAAVVAVAVVSSAAGLRQVIISPLGVSRRSDAPAALRWTRVVVALAVVAGALVLMRLASPSWGTVALAGAFGGAVIAVMAVLGVVGPFVVGRLAKRQHRRAEVASDVIASRVVLEEPRAAWRQVSGIALISFVVVPVGCLLGYIDLIERSGTVIEPAARQLLVDMRTVLLAAVVLSFVLVACSVAITQAAAILERRELYVSLDRIGMPLAEMARARRQAIIAPLRVAAVGSAAASGALFAWLVVIAVTTAPLFAAAVVAAIVGGELLIRLGLRATTTVLREVLRHPDRVM